MKTKRTNLRKLATMAMIVLINIGQVFTSQAFTLSFHFMPGTATVGTDDPGARQNSGQQTHNNSFIKGILLDEADQSPVSFATVALYRQADSALITGSVTNDRGEFRVGPMPSGDYFLAISFVGYQSAELPITAGTHGDYDAGVILLAEESVALEELVVTGRRMRAATDIGKTTYYANKRIQEASSTGIDLLKHVPGVHVDFMDNVLLKGSSNIIIMVDGRQRDASYLKQLDASQIDRVEVVSSPGAAYDASVTGVLNIRLNQRQSGVSGHVHAEVPVNSSEVYLMPNYSFNYGTGKVNLFTSYNGDIRRFDILETNSRTITNGTGTQTISSLMNVSQKTWSHRFHYGADYIMNDRNQFNFYGYLNPYSNEHGGDITILSRGTDGQNENFSGVRTDNDKNHIAFYSLYYLHTFNNPGNRLAVDLSYSDQGSETTTSYEFGSLPGNATERLITALNPRRNSASLKADLTSRISDEVNMETGIRGDLRRSADRISDDFNHHENVFAAYTSMSFSRNNLSLNGGIRVEQSVTGLRGNFENSNLALLPGAALNYRIKNNQAIRLSYRRSISRPGIYQLNPVAISDHPLSLRHGNPSLVPVMHENIYLDYSVRPGSGFISMRLFYNHASQDIHDLSRVNQQGLIETRLENLGDTRQYGIQLSGALNIFNSISLNPYMRLFGVNTTGGALAGEFDLNGRRETAWSAGMAAVASPGANITASFIINYDSPRHSLQNTTFSDALYFLSLEREINHKYKLGIMSGLPFARSFTYHGNRIEGSEFSCRSEGNILMSAVPVWIRFRYSFSSGKQVSTIQRDKEQIEKRPARGF
jgi:outer membrane receptor protein involved in Fe transport